MSSKAYSQQAVLNDKGDTTICFSVSQSKYLLKRINALNECDTLRSICEQQLTYCDSVSKSNKRIQVRMSEMMKVDRDLLSIYNIRISSLEQELQDEKKNTNRQKTYKWLSIIAGGLTTGFMTYLWIKK